MALRRVPIPSPFYSGRAGATVTTIVLHTAEGARTYQSLGAWFQNPAANVSSHVGIDDTPNTVGEYVPRSGKAWTQGNANPYSVSAELCAFAAWSSADWDSHPTMLANAAAWVAEEAAFFGIPLVKLSSAEAQDPGCAGVCQHVDLGQMGGGHVDCGPAFPMDRVLELAAGAGPAPDPLEVPDMNAAPCTFTMRDKQQVFAIAGNGQMLHWYQGADQPWIKEALSLGWDPESDLRADTSPGGACQVWARRSDGGAGQIYWNGRQWVTQPLP